MTLYGKLLTGYPQSQTVILCGPGSIVHSFCRLSTGLYPQREESAAVGWQKWKRAAQTCAAHGRFFCCLVATAAGPAATAAGPACFVVVKAIDLQAESALCLTFHTTVRTGGNPARARTVGAVDPLLFCALCLECLLACFAYEPHVSSLYRELLPHREYLRRFDMVRLYSCMRLELSTGCDCHFTNRRRPRCYCHLENCLQVRKSGALPPPKSDGIDAVPDVAFVGLEKRDSRNLEGKGYQLSLYDSPGFSESALA